MRRLLVRPLRLQVALTLLQELPAAAGGPAARALLRRGSQALRWEITAFRRRPFRMLLEAAGARESALSELTTLAKQLSAVCAATAETSQSGESPQSASEASQALAASRAVCAEALSLAESLSPSNKQHAGTASGSSASRRAGAAASSASASNGNGNANANSNGNSAQVAGAADAARATPAELEDFVLQHTSLKLLLPSSKYFEVGLLQTDPRRGR